MSSQLSQRLEKIRHTESHRINPADRWPLFDCQLLLLPDNNCRLLLRMDALLTDAGSAFILLKELNERYQKPDKALSLH